MVSRSARNSAKTSSQAPWFQLLLLLVAAIVLYLPSLDGTYIWDDDHNVTGNRLLHGEDQLRRIWTGDGGYQYYPLTFTSYVLQRELVGLDPRTCHAVNIILHALNGVLLFLLLRRIGLPWAFAAAAVFAVHPVCVESVAWITERKNLLAGFFFLLSLLSFAHFDHGRSRRWYVVSLVAFLLATLSKTHTVMLPGVLLLYLWWRRRPWTVRTFGNLVPFFVVSALLALVTIRFETGHVVGQTGGMEWEQSLLERLANAGRIIWFYAGKVIVPNPLIFVYEQWKVDAAKLLTWVPAVGLILTAGAFYLKRRSWGRHALFAFGYYVVALSPVLGFFRVYFMRYAYVQDHFQYFAAMGLISVLVGAAAPALADRLGLRHRRAIWGAAAALLIALLCGLTWRQQGDYQDQETLWARTIEKNPRAWLALTGLGVIRLESGEIEAAIGLHRRAVEVAGDRSEPHNNLGYALALQGHVDEAEAHYRTAMRLAPSNAMSRLNLANLLTTQQRFDEAIDILEHALVVCQTGAGRQLHPRMMTNLGVALLWAGRLEDAVERWRQALELMPELREAYVNLASTLGQVSDVEARLGIMEEMCAPSGCDNPALLDLLAGTYTDAGRIAEATATARRALRLAMDRPPSWLSETIRRRVQVLEQSGL